jgi:predicted DNA-binding transcriptional regulator YafY
MELTVADLWEVKRWLIGWGADVEVLEPAELRDAVCKEATGVLEIKRRASPQQDQGSEL